MENIELTPKQIVEKLDSYIIGQDKAKRAVAVALRNRVRRLKLPEDIRDEVAPKNILMIGSTGCGKTEIARRLAKLCGAPFLKVEATKYTEVGYVGRDVESMVRDLMAVGYNDVKAEMEESLKEKSVSIVEEKLLDLLFPGTGKKKSKKAMLLGFAISLPTHLVLAMVLNVYVLIPFFSVLYGLPLDALLAICQAAIPAIQDVGWSYAFFAVLPFNALKDAIVIVLSCSFYGGLRYFLERNR